MSSQFHPREITNLSAALKIIFARPRSSPVMAASATLASFAPELLLTGPLPARAWEKVTNSRRDRLREAERLWSELLIGAAPLISGHSPACPNPRKQSIGMGLALFSRRANMLVPQRSQRFPKSSAGDALPSDSSFLTSQQCSSAAKSPVLGSRNSVLYPLCWHFYTFGTVTLG
jgi:hypothetical protein